MSGLNVIYDKTTRRVLLIEEGGIWTMPTHLELAHYAEGSEPVFIEGYHGSLYLKPNTVIINDL